MAKLYLGAVECTGVLDTVVVDTILLNGSESTCRVAQLAGRYQNLVSRTPLSISAPGLLGGSVPASAD